MERIRERLAGGLRQRRQSNCMRGHREVGATATEYALLVGVIVLVVAAGVGVFGAALDGLFKALANGLSGWLG